MPISNHSGTFTAFQLPDEAVQSMPKPARKAWDDYQQAVGAHQEAFRVAVGCVEAINAAIVSDRVGAELAAANGEALPELALPNAEQAEAEAQRRVTACATIADRAERAWLEVAEQHRRVWLGTVQGSVDTLATEAATRLAALNQPLDDLGRVEAVREWLKPTVLPNGRPRALTMRRPGGPVPLVGALSGVVADVEALRGG